MKKITKLEDWYLENSNQKSKIKIVKSIKGITIKNNNEKKANFNLGYTIKPEKKSNYALIKFDCDVENAGGCLYINDRHPVPAQSKAIIEINCNDLIMFNLTISAESTIENANITLEYLEENVDFVEECNTKSDVLVVVPNYPSYENLYYCGFAHSRNKEYLANGINIQVVAVDSSYWYQTSYEIDGVPVIKCNYQSLKKMLSKHQYKVIVTHFIDENLYPIYDGYISNNEKMINICHGPETIFRNLANIGRNYFTEPIKYPIINSNFDLKDKYLKRFSKKENVEWVFVSDWLKNFSEKELNLKFKNVSVINNIINEELFPYVKKKESDRLNILIIRKFDNIIQHSIDQCVLAILELSKRPFFDKLNFDVYGDGNYYDTLVAPLLQFKNVHLHRTFIPNNQISKIHKKAGIIMLPSRHDAHAVAMGEAASSGLVVVGSNVTSNGFFMNNEVNHTLCDPEDFVGLANIIERLYNNPKEFLEISERLSKETRKRCCKKNTVMKEVKLIKKCLKEYSPKLKTLSIKPNKNPILTVVVPAYNVEAYLDKCLRSLVNQDNAENLEVIVVNDGSTDGTLKIAKKYAKATNGIVKVIDKKNGGHGSTINEGLRLASGKYFRLVDGDDWVDSENLSKLINIMKNSNVDLILTKGSYEYVEESKLENIIDYNMLTEGVIYDFESLIYDGYGFKTYGPLLTTGNYKTELLKKAKFTISEHKPYVDMEFNAFSLRYITTVTHYKLDIYRYLIGRAGQTISRDFWKKKYKDHEYVIFNILDKVEKTYDLSDAKKKYINRNIIAQMVDSQIFMYDALCYWDEIDKFLNKLKKYENAYKTSIDYINEKNGNCRLILYLYKKYVSNRKTNRNSIIIPGKRECMADIELGVKTRTLKWYIKKVIKFISPYCLVRWVQNRRNV